MNLHANAALSLNGRRLLAGRIVDQGWRLSEAAAAAGVSVRCARKWAARYRLRMSRLPWKFGGGPGVMVTR